MSSLPITNTDFSSSAVIRDARADDANAIAELYRQLTANPRINVLPERIDAIAKNDDHHLLVAEIDGRVCGSIMATLCMDAMFGMQPFTVVENVIVDPGRRGYGIGAKLFARIEALSLVHGSSKIMLLSATERTEAHQFFEQLGYRGDKKCGFVKYRRDFPV